MSPTLLTLLLEAYSLGQTTTPCGLGVGTCRRLDRACFVKICYQSMNIVLFRSDGRGAAGRTSLLLLDRMPLHSAASSRNVGGIRLLLEWGAAVDARDTQGCTPLFAACKAKAHRYACLAFCHDTYVDALTP